MNNPQIKFRLLYPGVELPAKAHGTDAMYDVIAISRWIADSYVVYGLGFATEMPENWAGYLYPRSSISDKDLQLCNSVGVIDAGFRGEWSARFKFVPNFSQALSSFGVFDPAKLNAETVMARLYEVGDKIGQICFAPLPAYDLVPADSLSSTERGTGGFGSTDKS